MGNRASSLELARFCGAASKLSEEYGGSRRALMGTCFHAMASGEPDADDRFLRLSDDEAQEVALWHKPEPYVFEFEGKGFTLDYKDAIKEAGFCIRNSGRVNMDGLMWDALKTVTTGHVDLYWIVEHKGQKVAVVEDIKSSLFTVADGPTTMQFLTYGYMVAKYHGCDSFIPSMWGAKEGVRVSGKKVDMFMEGEELFERIRAAAGNHGEAVTGLHCRGCYARMHCKEHLLPAALGEGPLAAMAEGNTTVTSENYTELYLWSERAKEMSKIADERLLEFGRRGGQVECGERKLSVRTMKGRSSFSAKKAKEMLTDEQIKECTVVGQPFPKKAWVKK